MNEIARPIEVITQEIRFYKLQAGTSIIEIGKRLLEAKQCLPHGKWGEWLQSEAEFSERTAQNFMRIAREYQNPQMLADMGNSASKALLLLSLPPEEREGFVSEAHEVGGESKTAAEMTTKEMEELLKQLEEERAERRKLQGQLDLFEGEAQKRLDDKLDEALAAHEDEMDAAYARRDEAEQARKAAEERAERLETELAELRQRAEQPPKPDESELEKIRAEAEKAAADAMQKKLDKAKKDLEKAKTEAKEAQDAVEAHEAAQKEAEEAAQKTREEMKRLEADTEKKLKAAGSSGIARFKVCFEGVQYEVNRMLGFIADVEESESAEEAAKLRSALAALCRNILEGIGEA